MLFIIITTIPVLFLLSHYLWKAYQFRSLPSPGFFQYLPGGLIFPMLYDPGNSSLVLTNLHKTYGNLFHLWLGPNHSVYTAVPEDIAQALSQTDIFIRPRAAIDLFKSIVPDGISTKTGEPYRVVRRKFQRHFTPSLVQGFHSKISLAISEHCQKLTNLSIDTSTGTPTPVTVDMSKELATVTLRIMTNAAFGFSLTEDERATFSKLVYILFDELLAEFVQHPIRQILTPFGTRNNYFRIKKQIELICSRCIQERLSRTTANEDDSPADILDIILSITDRDLEKSLSYAIEFMIAGFHSTSVTIAWAFYELCCNPAATAKLREEITTVRGNRPLDQPITVEEVEKLSYVRKIWKETNRLHAAAAFFVKTLVEDVKLKGSGLSIPKGTQVMFSTMVQHRHAQFWTQPLQFMPERWDVNNDRDQARPGTYFPFSLGPRSCVGRSLAEYEGLLFLVEYFRKFDFELACQPDEVVSRTAFTESGRSSSKNNGVFDMGIPMKVTARVQ